MFTKVWTNTATLLIIRPSNDKGAVVMVTQLGKILRIIRVNTGENMRVMAEKLKVSVSYLSAIENGKRNVPANFGELVAGNYDLSAKDKKNLRDAIQDSTEKMKVNITELGEKKKRILYALTSDDLDEETLSRLVEIIDKKGDNQ